METNYNAQGYFITQANKSVNSLWYWMMNAMLTYKLYTGWLKKLDSTLDIYLGDWVYQAKYLFIVFDKGANL